MFCLVTFCRFYQWGGERNIAPHVLAKAQQLGLGIIVMEFFPPVQSKPLRRTVCVAKFLPLALFFIKEPAGLSLFIPLPRLKFNFKFSEVLKFKANPVHGPPQGTKFYFWRSQGFKSLVVRGGDTYISDNVNIWRYSAQRGCMNKILFKEPSICCRFCFSLPSPPVTRIGIAGSPFIFLSLLFRITVEAAESR
jgi:hypothetical protein